MRRFVIVFAVAALAVALVALPSAAKDKPLPDDVVFTSGVSTYSGVVARTGEFAGDFGPGPGWDHLMNPEHHRCVLIEGTLSWTDTNKATLYTKETCPKIGPLQIVRTHYRNVHITPSGALKTSPVGNLWTKVPMLTGCDIDGTFPVYHGRFDGERLSMTSHYHSICDGGKIWGNFGIDKDDGPIHITYEVILDVVD